MNHFTVPAAISTPPRLRHERAAEGAKPKTGTHSNSSGHGKSTAKNAQREPCRRKLADRELCERIRVVHRETEGIYGSPRIHAELRLEHGVHVRRKRVARLRLG
ncbi:MAG TPA: IS3 family transposase [Gaiellaceae bacterium]